MKEYEITYLVDPKLDEKAKDEVDAVIDGAIAKLEGEISYSSPTDSPGSRRRIHYPIKKQRVAWMRALQVALEPDKIDELRSIIKKAENVLRVTILQSPRREEVSAKIFDVAEKVAAAPQAAAQDAKPAKKVTMEEVEEKIEEALVEEVK